MFPCISKTKFKLSVIIFIAINIHIALISGVVSGFLGSFAGSLTFISTYNYLTHLIYADKKYADVDFRKKNFMIYLASDFTSSLAKIFFEARK
jgi:hypothetical protein